MERIAKLADMIREEVCDAAKYAKLALQLPGPERRRTPAPSPTSPTRSLGTPTGCTPWS